MKIGFIGGSGHHYLRRLVQRPEHSGTQFAVAGDGNDPVTSDTFAAGLLQARPDVIRFDDGVALLDSFQPDVVSIGAVYGYNGVWNARALERDIAVVSDKPAAATWPQYERLLALVSAKPERVLLMEFDFRCRPEFRAARDAVAAGAIGDVVLVSAQKSYKFGTRATWYADRTAYGGTLLWIASHGIDAVEFVTGKRITKIIGRQGNVSQPARGSMEDHVAVLAELEGGATAVVHADLCRPPAAPTHGDDRLRVVGSRGTVEVCDDRCTLTTHDAAPTEIKPKPPVRPIDLELFSAATGEPSPQFSTAISLATARLLLHARDAADGAMWVDTSN